MPTGKWPCGAEAVNAKIEGRSAHFKADKKKGWGSQLRTRNLIGAVLCKICLFCEKKSFVEALWKNFCISFCVEKVLI